MLETREHLALVVERDEKRLESTARSAIGGQQVIRVAAPGPTPDHLETLAARDMLRAAPRFADIAEEVAERHTQRRREGGQGFETGRHVPVFHAAQHSGADVRSFRDL